MTRPAKDQVMSWNVEVLREIADAVETEGAPGSTAGIEPGLDEIRRQMRVAIHDLEWSGAAFNAATGRADEEWTDIGRIVNAYNKIGGYCRSAYRGMSYSVTELQTQVRTVEASGGTVDQDWTVHGLRDAEEDTNITTRLQSMADEVGREDQRWAPDIAQAVAELREMAPKDAALGGIPAPPGSGQPSQATDPAANRAWWDSLTDDQKAFMIATQPQSVGALDGLPATDRDKANRSMLGWMERDLQTQLANADNSQQRTVLQYKLDDLKAIRAQVEGNPERLLMVLNKDGGERMKAAIAVGNPDTATHISVTTPGLNTNATDSLGGMVKEAVQLRTHSQQLLDRAGHGNETVATIAWLGFEPPQNVTLDDAGRDPVGAAIGAIGVLNQDRAEASAPALASFYEGLDVSHQASGNGDPHITALGHSYGSTTQSLALQQLHDQGKSVIDEAIFYGSPGLGGDWPAHDNPRPGDPLVRPQDLGLDYGHAFSMAAPDDLIARLDRFGYNPTTTPGYIDLETQTIKVGETEYQGAHGHSEYPRATDNGAPRITTHNMAAILTGVYNQAREEGRPNTPYQPPE